jgi:predicted transcriptional regulator
VLYGQGRQMMKQFTSGTTVKDIQREIFKSIQSSFKGDTDAHKKYLSLKMMTKMLPWDNKKMLRLIKTKHVA